METTKDYTKRYRQNPLALVLDVHNLRNGLYHVDGDVEKQSWQEVCDVAGVKPVGNIIIDIDIDKLSFKMHITGSITANIEMECIRSLKKFEKQLDINIDEDIFLTDPREGEEADEILTEDSFNVGDFIREIIHLNIDPYPVHESTLNIPKGEFGLSDGLEEEIKTEKNPFAVLKNLKKT